MLGISMEKQTNISGFNNRLRLYDPVTGDVDVDKTAAFLGITLTELASVFGVTKEQIRPDRAGTKTKQRIEQLTGALEAVAEKSFNGDFSKTQFWIKTPNPNFGYISPRTLILKGRYSKVIKFIESVLHAD